MPPKKTSTAAPKEAKKASTAPQHASYLAMIQEAVINLKERNGSSRQALKKYVLANNVLGNVNDATFTSLFNRALAKGSESGVFARPKGPSGPVKLAKPESGAKTAAKPAATKKAATKKEDSPAAAKKTTKAAATKKAPAAKKTAAATKATKTTKAAATKTTKAAATKKAPAAKANTSKKAAPKKTTTKAAPAVPEETKPVELTKTKTGRVVKSSQPQKVAKVVKPKKAAATTKKAAPKKAAAKK
ncbi:hypothetical protein Q7P36_006194 [Cladosporium allicinum]